MLSWKASELNGRLVGDLSHDVFVIFIFQIYENDKWRLNDVVR